MKKEEPRVRKFLVIIFAIILLGVLTLLIVTTDVFDRSYRNDIMPFSGIWEDEKGTEYRIVELVGGKLPEGTILSKKLPEHLTDADCLCFESRNCNFNVYVEGTKLYSFKSKENLSGLGYGHAFHEVNLRAAYSGKTVRIEMDGVYEGQNGGRIFSLYICTASDYFHLQVDERILSVILSAMTLFFGIIMILVFIWIPGKERLPFDIASLGLSAFALGTWLFGDTGIIQLLTGQLYAWRAIDRVVIFFVGFPLVSFFNSLTAKKRVVYQRAWFFATLAFIVSLIGLRYFAGVDMIESYTPALVVFIAGLLLTFLIIFIDNSIYCRKHNINIKLKYFFAGMTVLIGCAFLDLVFYSVRFSSVETYGTFTRVGTVAFIFIMMLQFLNWWAKDQATIGRERFINRILQDSIASGSSEDSIRTALEYIGTELKLGRTIIFEERSKGRFHGTYEWFEEGRDPDVLELLYIPYQGLIDKLYDNYRASGKALIVEDVEACQDAHPALYNLLSPYHVQNLAVIPMEENDGLAGLFVLLDVPKQALSAVNEIIGTISYFLSQLILRRDEEKRLRHYSYNDTLSGALNRRAYLEYINQDIDTSVSFGYLVCEIDGLKDANNIRGYDAGDRMVQLVVDTLAEIFGKDSVYRAGGSQFVAFGSESEEAFFNNDVNRFRRKVEENGVHVFVGTVYCIYGTRDIAAVISRANQHLSEERAAK